MRPVRNSPHIGFLNRAKRAGAISNGMHYVIGIDEVGRGPLAGPVVLAAAAMPIAWRPKRGQGRATLKDSKKLTAVQREEWQEYLANQPQVIFAIAKSYPKAIDETNISQAANKAARRALLMVLKRCDPSAKVAGVYLDGGLYLRRARQPRKRAKIHTEEIILRRGQMKLLAHTVIKGDEQILPVKIASILAKVYRDRLMTKAAKSFPGYGFERHKGYGTKSHRAAIDKLGPSKIHRLTFRSFSSTSPEVVRKGSTPPQAGR